jgi:hypothetical protein
MNSACCRPRAVLPPPLPYDALPPAQCPNTPARTPKAPHLVQQDIKHVLWQVAVCGGRHDIVRRLCQQRQVLLRVGLQPLHKLHVLAEPLHVVQTHLQCVALPVGDVLLQQGGRRGGAAFEWPSGGAANAGPPMPAPRAQRLPTSMVMYLGVVTALPTSSWLTSR